MRLRRTIAVLCGSFMLVGPLAGVGAAGPNPTGAPAAGTSVDLRQGWGKFAACLVKPGGAVECFADAKGMKARSDQMAMGQAGPARSSPTMASTSSTWCPIFLYTASNYNGRVLELTGRGYWVNLSDYGFDNQIVSFIGQGCGFHLADYQWGGGWWYPGYTGAWAYAPDMGGWNYRVSSAYIS